MIQMNPQYIIDDAQQTTAVVLPVNEWNNVLDALEELDDIRAYDQVKSQSSDAIPFEQAIGEIE